MKDRPLSKKAIHVLEDNGYKFKKTDNLIVFKRATEYTSIVVVSFIILIVAGPLFIINPLLAWLTIILGAAGLYVRFKYYSKKMNFTANLTTKKFDFFDNSIELERQSLSFAKKLIIHSRFVSEYSSSFKSTSEEHEISMRIQLLSGSIFTLFKFHSDYEEPSEEMMEVHDFVKNLIKWTRNKEAQYKFQTSESE
ncbi:MAG: hypothetical protein ABJP45_03655 [Cyclobacteriaceae bacterium]